MFPDERLRKQITDVLPAKGVASLNVHHSDGWGGFIVSLDRGRCYDIELGFRDADLERLRSRRPPP